MGGAGKATKKQPAVQSHSWCSITRGTYRRQHRFLRRADSGSIRPWQFSCRRRPQSAATAGKAALKLLPCCHLQLRAVALLRLLPVRGTSSRARTRESELDHPSCWNPLVFVREPVLSCACRNCWSVGSGKAAEGSAAVTLGPRTQHRTATVSLRVPHRVPSGAIVQPLALSTLVEEAKFDREPCSTRCKR